MDDRLAASWRQARISGVRENLCEVIEQVAAYSGAADDELMSDRAAGTARDADEKARRARVSTLVQG